MDPQNENKLMVEFDEGTGVSDNLDNGTDAVNIETNGESSLIVTSCKPPKKSTPSEDNLSRELPWPEDETSNLCLSRLNNWSYVYMSKILNRGAEIHRLSQRKHHKNGNENSGATGRNGCCWRGKGVPSDAQESRELGNGVDVENGRDSEVDPMVVKQLSMADLYDAPSDMRASVLRPKFK